jgi:hypothetical protein
VAEPTRAKFTPFPKKRNPKADKQGGRPVIDVEKVRDQYVNGRDYSWTAFCRTHNYDVGRRSDLFREGKNHNWVEWKTEWQKRQLNVYDEELTPELLSTAAVVTRQRIAYVNDWGKRSRYLKTLFDAMVEKHGRDFNHDQQNMLAIRAGRAQAQFKLEPSEMSVIAATAERLQQLELRSMLVVADPEKVKRLEKEIDHEVNDMPEVDVSMIGTQMTADDTVRLMASYFDQFQPDAPAKAPEAAEVKKIESD